MFGRDDDDDKGKGEATGSGSAPVESNDVENARALVNGANYLKEQLIGINASLDLDNPNLRKLETKANDIREKLENLYTSIEELMDEGKPGTQAVLDEAVAAADETREYFNGILSDKINLKKTEMGMIPVEPEKLEEAQAYLNRAHYLKEQLTQIHAALDEPDAELARIEELEEVAAARWQDLEELKSGIQNLKAEDIRETLDVLEDAELAALDTSDYFNEVSDKIELKKSELDEELPPALPADPVIDDEETEDENDYFFAKTEDEYNARAAIVKPLAEDMANTSDSSRSQRLLRQANGLAVSATTPETRDAVRKNIDKEIELTKQYIAFLNDEIERFDGNHFNPKTREERADDFRDPPEIAAGVTPEEAIDERKEKIELLEESLVTLKAAKTNAAKDETNAPTQHAFYSKVDKKKEFTDPDNATNLQNAQQEARTWLNEQLAKWHRPAAAATSSVMTGVVADKRIDAKSKVNFIGTEVVIKPGKPAIPVAIVQEINEKQTYSEQTFLVDQGHMKKLQEFPLFASAKTKMEIIREQNRFALNAIENGMSAITENGPVEPRNMGKDLTDAFAFICYMLEYEFVPKSVLDDLKKSPAKLEARTHAFKEQLKDPAFKKDFDEAVARRDSKREGHKPTTPRR